MEWDNDCESEWNDVYEGVQMLANSLSMAIIDSFSGWIDNVIYLIELLIESFRDILLKFIIMYKIKYFNNVEQDDLIKF